MWSGVKSHQFCLHTPVPCSLSPGPFIATSDLTSVTSACPTALPSYFGNCHHLFLKSYFSLLAVLGNCQSKVLSTFGKGEHEIKLESQDFKYWWNDTGIEDDWTGHSNQSSHEKLMSLGVVLGGRTWFSSSLEPKTGSYRSRAEGDQNISFATDKVAGNLPLGPDGHVGLLILNPPK